MKIAIVAEFYPREADPVSGVWAHRQALAARQAGAEVRVLVLHRLVPPQSSLARGPLGALRSLKTLLAEPHRQSRDGIPVTYVRYVSPPRGQTYPRWGGWAAPALTLALHNLRRSFAFDLVHAHNAVPAADAVQRALGRRLAGSGGRSERSLGSGHRSGRALPIGRRFGRVPLVVSVHGGDVLYTAPRSPAGRVAVQQGLGAAELVLANSRGIAELSEGFGAREVRVVHLGTDMPTGPSRQTGRAGQPQSLVTVGHLVARKRHADVMRAMAVLGKRHPALRYVIVGDGPERATLEGLATRLGVAERVEFRGALPHDEAVAVARGCTLFAMPSTEEAFGVAYVEAMAGGLPAIGCRGEPGPEEIAAAGDGFMLVPPGDIERLSQRIDELLCDPQRLREASLRARETVAANFTWELCGKQTIAAYEHALAKAGSALAGAGRAP